MFRIYLCMMITNCEGKRFFSKLARIKNQLRSTMGQQRQVILTLMNIEHEMLSKLDFSRPQNSSDRPGSLGPGGPKGRGPISDVYDRSQPKKSKCWSRSAQFVGFEFQMLVRSENGLKLCVWIRQIRLFEIFWIVKCF